MGFFRLTLEFTLYQRTRKECFCSIEYFLSRTIITKKINHLRPCEGIFKFFKVGQRCTTEPINKLPVVPHHKYIRLLYRPPDSFEELVLYPGRVLMLVDE